MRTYRAIREVTVWLATNLAKFVIFVMWTFHFLFGYMAGANRKEDR